ncbi:MAG: helix-turn-helix transcriptional regulator [Oscillospiraceae bacterium]|nr:helix-turn-helix transcriptional regulator [Oscillospiraceae bacterium]
MEQKTIGKFIAVLRKSQGMTQKELAEKLGVSDKTVSHWEREESAPDISLIPVIAEIFSVTCDELLRGEKSSKQAEVSETYNENKLSEKGEKQMKYLFEKALGRLKMKSIICIGIDAVGYVVSLIVTYLVGMRFGTDIEYMGLLFAAVFYIVSLVLTGVFRFQFGVSVKNDDFAISKSYYQKANMVSFFTAGITAIVFCYTLPVCTRYYTTGEQFIHGSVYAAVCLAILAVVFAVLTAKGLLSSKDRTNKQKKLFSLRLIVAVVTVCILAGTAVWEISFISEPNYDDYGVTQVAVYDDIDEFIDLMTTPTPIPNYADEETQLDIEEKMSLGEYTVTVDGEEYRFEWKNGDVRFFCQSDEGLPIDVSFVENNRASIEQGTMQDKVYIAGYVFYPSVVLIAFLIYVLLKRRIDRLE